MTKKINEGKYPRGTQSIKDLQDKENNVIIFKSLPIFFLSQQSCRTVHLACGIWCYLWPKLLGLVWKAPYTHITGSGKPNELEQLNSKMLINTIDHGKINIYCQWKSLVKWKNIMVKLVISHADCQHHTKLKKHILLQ